ncbi:hypothetical protein [Candidatus Villigracilis proximus]|uniref:hypothetical protein n=1 Tax=Candidatus Villigracilis proximus TaxID=3140683 RepID=UPI0031EB2E6D
MSFLNLWLNSGLVILGLMTALWLLSLALKNSSIVDIFGARVSSSLSGSARY